MVEKDTRIVKEGIILKKIKIIYIKIETTHRGEGCKIYVTIKPSQNILHLFIILIGRNLLITEELQNLDLKSDIISLEIISPV